MTWSIYTLSHDSESYIHYGPPVKSVGVGMTCLFSTSRTDPHQILHHHQRLHRVWRGARLVAVSQVSRCSGAWSCIGLLSCRSRRWSHNTRVFLMVRQRRLASLRGFLPAGAWTCTDLPCHRSQWGIFCRFRLPSRIWVSWLLILRRASTDRCLLWGIPGPGTGGPSMGGLRSLLVGAR